MNDRKPVPDFVIIGAMKAGTTSLHAYLAEHPQICMSTQKDTNFFAGKDNWNRGFEWYHSLFLDREKLVGETSAGYSMHPRDTSASDIPRRMARMNPQMKIIYALRDPISRIISHFAHNVAAGREKRTIGEALKKLDRNHYVNTSLYHFQISQYLECFDKSRTLLITTESLQFSRADVLQRVFRFLGVDESFTSANFAREFHRTSGLRQMTALGATIRNVPLLGKAAARLPITSKPVQKSRLSSETRHSLAEFLAPDVTALETLTGEQYSAWTTFYEAVAKHSP